MAEFYKLCVFEGDSESESDSDLDVADKLLKELDITEADFARRERFMARKYGKYEKRNQNTTNDERKEEKTNEQESESTKNEKANEDIGMAARMRQEKGGLPGQQKTPNINESSKDTIVYSKDEQDLMDEILKNSENDQANKHSGMAYHTTVYNKEEQELMEEILAEEFKRTTPNEPEKVEQRPKIRRRGHKMGNVQGTVESAPAKVFKGNKTDNKRSMEKMLKCEENIKQFNLEHEPEEITKEKQSVGRKRQTEQKLLSDECIEDNKRENQTDENRPKTSRGRNSRLR